MLEYVFVYGSLKKGHWNNRVLQDSKLVGKALTHDKFKMLNSGFPVLTPDVDGRQVRGEVYCVTNPDVMRDLDRLEGLGRMYDRKVHGVALDGSIDMTVYVYVGTTGFVHSRQRMEHPGQRGEDIWVNAAGEFEWALKRENLLDDTEEDDGEEVDDCPDDDDDEQEHVEPEDQSQGDVLGHDDERGQS